MIDTHCHLYLKDFESDIEQVLQDATSTGVSAFFLPAIDSETHSDVLSLQQKYPGKVFAMMGLHPCSVKGTFEEEISVIRKILDNEPIFGIGETGLDYYWDEDYKKEQEESLKIHMHLAEDHALPLILHTRKSMNEAIDIIKQNKNPDLTGIFHCFSGSAEQATEAIKLNFYLGIGGVLTYKNSGLQKVLENIPMERIVLETDAPYLTPVPHRGMRNESKYLTHVVDKIAEIKGISTTEVVNITTANAKKIFTKAFNGAYN